jgi:hypothetical protein
MQQWLAFLPWQLTGARSNWPPCHFEPIEEMRIIDQESLTLRQRWRDLRETVDQHAIVRNGTTVIGMRPIGTPNDTVSELLHQLARKGHRVGIRRSLSCNAVNSAHFRPDVFILHEREQRSEWRLFNPECGINAAHMVYHDRSYRAFDDRRQFGNTAGVHLNLKMPADVGDPFAKRDHLVGRRAYPALHEVKSRASNTGAIETP